MSNIHVLLLSESVQHLPSTQHFEDYFEDVVQPREEALKQPYLSRVSVSRRNDDGSDEDDGVFDFMEEL